MPNPADWIPVDWPAPWAQPERLKVLEGSPVNCLLLSAPASAPLREAAARAHLDLIEPGSKQVAWSLLKEINWADPANPVAIKDGFWPQLAWKKGDEAQAGPTGAPWLDSNSWIIQLARSRAPGRTIWITSEPPADPLSVRPASFLLAVTEAWVFGARRPVWIPADRFDSIWKNIPPALEWMGQHREWTQWSVPASLTVVSDFSGPNEYMSSEVLNLAVRQNILFSALERKRLDAAALRGRRAVLWIDSQAPDAAQTKILRAFVEAGGLLLCQNAAAAPFGKLSPHPDFHTRFSIATLGKGRVAVSRADYDDPWTLISDAHLLTSRRWDPVRLYNGGSLNWHYTLSPDGKRAVLHLLNYSLGPSGNQVSVQFLAPAQSARWYVLSKPTAQSLEIRRSPGRQEIWLPPFDLYAAVELELRG
jgi:hypothetical protein